LGRRGGHVRNKWAHETTNDEKEVVITEAVRRSKRKRITNTKWKDYEA